MTARGDRDRVSRPAGIIGPMELEEPEDDPGFYRSPLPPEDRLWRHPSEMGLPPAARPSRRSLWLVAGASALGASLISTGLVILAGTLLFGSTDTPVQREMVVRPLTTTVSDGDDAAVRIAEQVGPAIARLELDDRRSGSGVLFRSDGHLLTNAHLVEGATALTVVLGNGRELVGRVIGSDPDTDIAVVKVDGGTLPVVTMGTASDLEVGEKAIAVSSPPGPAGGPSVSVGVVRALHRNVTGPGTRPMYDMVQTDASIAPGSSGGALLDTAGSVVGITTAVAGSDVAAKGAGFAVPIDVARSVADQLVASGRVVNVWIGIQGHDVDGATATEIDVEGGAMVADVKRDSPADRSGLAARDVIVAVDGRPIESIGQLVMALRLQRPGSAVTLDVVRERRRHTMTVTVAERPADA